MFRQASMFLYFQEGNYLKSYEMQLMSLELAGNEPTADQYWNFYATCNWLKDEKKAIEVKETPGPSDLKTLQSRAANIGIGDTLLVGRFPPGSEFHEFVWGGCVF